MRLQHYLAKAGIASRRKAEQIIADGRVTVNGEIVLLMGKTVEEGDVVCVDGKPVKPAARTVTVMYFKPRGVVCTASDEKGRPIVTDIVKDFPERLYPVGRLDMNSEGLLLLTNDGELALRMTHPRFGVEKCYIASLADHVTGEAIQRLRQGVVIDGKKTAPAKVRRLESFGEHEKLEIIIHEGRNRQVRKMMEAVGNKVLRLVRVSVGPLNIRGLKVGQWRELSEEEIGRLKYALGYEGYERYKNPPKAHRANAHRAPQKDASSARQMKPNAPRPARRNDPNRSANVDRAMKTGSASSNVRVFRADSVQE